jgi:hypothetical protein
MMNIKQIPNVKGLSVEDEKKNNKTSSISNFFFESFSLTSLKDLKTVSEEKKPESSSTKFFFMKGKSFDFGFRFIPGGENIKELSVLEASRFMNRKDREREKNKKQKIVR